MHPLNQDKQPKFGSWVYLRPNKNLNDIHVICTIRIELKRQNSEHRFIKKTANSSESG